jgi:hypothetical protein
MTSRRWQDKVTVYRKYMQSPKLQDDYKAHWFIQLTLATTERRIDSLAKATAELGGRRGFWFAPSGSITPDSALQQIWVRVSDLYELRNEQLTKMADPAKATRIALPDSVS